MVQSKTEVQPHDKLKKLKINNKENQDISGQNENKSAQNSKLR